MRKLLIAIVIFSIGSVGYGYINIFPATFDKEITSSGGYQEYVFYNPSKEKARYSITFFDGEDDEKMDMSKWITYYPKVVTVNPGGEAKLKVLVNKPTDAKAGHYTTIMGVKELENIDNKKENKGSVVQMLMNVRLGLHGYVKEDKIDMEKEYKEVYKISDAEIKDLEDGGVEIGGTLLNQGDWSPRLSLIVNGKNGRRNQKQIGRIWKGEKYPLITKIEGMKRSDIESIEIKTEVEKLDVYKKEIR